MTDTSPSGQLSIWHIYATNPSYTPVLAEGEGCSCVDDVARIVVFFLRQFRHQPDAVYLQKARAGLDFVLRLQQPDGYFHNFVYPDGSINTEGITSYRTLGWWAARAVWALGTAVAVFQAEDAPYAEMLRERMGLTMDAIRCYIEKHADQYRRIHGVLLPAWYPDDAVDAAADTVLGLCELYAATGDALSEQIIRRYCAGFVDLQHGTAEDFPFQAHLNSAGAMHEWHTWGHRQVAALARAGQLLGEPGWILSAERAANGMYARLIASWGPAFGMTPRPRPFDQIAYNVEMLAGGFLALYRATGKDLYARMAGLAASWLFGNNPPGAPMYDPDTGRCLDGISCADDVNLHSGAESTVCALLTLADLADVPAAQAYLSLRADDFGLDQVLCMGDAVPTAGGPRFGSDPATPGAKVLRMQAGDEVRLLLSAARPGDYVLHLAYERQADPAALVSVRLDDGRPVYHWQGGSPDSPHPWMSCVGSFDDLDVGEHTLDIACILGPVRLDAALFHPAVMVKTLFGQESGGAPAVVPSAFSALVAKALGRGERRVVLLKNLRPRAARVAVSGWARPAVLAYDGNGNPLAHGATITPEGTLDVPVAPLGLTLVEG